MKELGKVLEKEQKVRDNLNLELFLKLQKQNPNIIISGSSALYLHGMKLKRWSNAASDLDIIMPYYYNFEDIDDIKVQDTNTKPSGNDFDYVTMINGVVIDISIDNKKRYKVIELDDNKYKVSLIEDILEAKIKYTKSSGVKHKDDLYEILGLVIPKDVEDSRNSWLSGS